MNIDCKYGTETLEFKTSLSELDRGILSLTAMLNKSGNGKVYFGVSDNGSIIGLDGEIGKETIKKISTRIAEIVKPTIVPKIYFEEYGGKTIIGLEVTGYNKPYSADGEYRIRIGSENKKIDPDVLGELFFSSSNASISNIESINQDLTFNDLQRLYIAKGLTIDNSTFLGNMGLLTKKGSYNLLAELLADNNDCSIKVVRFKGKDKSEMLSRNEYGYKCLIIAMKQAFEYVSALNEVKVNLEKGMEREETPLFDKESLDEAWTNACIHNRWVKNIPPAIYIFSDRIEVVSSGGLPIDFSEEEFFRGVSHPVNVPLLKIMGQLGIIEQTGHGVPKIISRYGKEAFNLSDNHITVTLPFAFEPTMNQFNYEGLMQSEKKVYETLKENPCFSTKELAEYVGLGTTRTSEIIATLKKTHRIERVGGNRGGYWKIIGKK